MKTELYKSSNYLQQDETVSLSIFFISMARKGLYPYNQLFLKLQVQLPSLFISCLLKCCNLIEEHNSLFMHSVKLLAYISKLKIKHVRAKLELKLELKLDINFLTNTLCTGTVTICSPSYLCERISFTKLTFLRHN